MVKLGEKRMLMERCGEKAKDKIACFCFPPNWRDSEGEKRRDWKLKSPRSIII